MSRDDGFSVMDMSTDIANDPKFRKVYRLDPCQVAPAFMAYLATVAESWKAGRRVTAEDAWPPLLPFDGAILQAMMAVGLLDRSGKVPLRAWLGWYEGARKRREGSRESWRRYNEKRRQREADTT